MGVETGLLQRMGLRIDPTLRQTVQSQVIDLFNRTGNYILKPTSSNDIKSV